MSVYLSAFLSVCLHVWLAGLLAGWLACWLAGLLVDWLTDCFSGWLSVCLSACLSLDVGSVVFYFVLCGKTVVRGPREQEFKSTCAALAAIVPRNIVARRGPFLCHSCPRVFNVISFVGALSLLSFLWIMSLSAVGQGCARIFFCFLSLASAFILQLDGLLLSFLCPIVFLWLQLASAISQGCVHTFLLLSEIGVRLRLTVGLSFVAYSSSTRFLVSAFAVDGLVSDFDIIQVH